MSGHDHQNWEPVVLRKSGGGGGGGGGGSGGDNGGGNDGGLPDAELDAAVSSAVGAVAVAREGVRFLSSPSAADVGLAGAPSSIGAQLARAHGRVVISEAKRDR